MVGKSQGEEPLGVGRKIILKWIIEKRMF